MKMRAIILTIIVLTATSVLAFAAAGKLTVAKLIDNPSKYSDKKVKITGTVSNSYGVNILGQGGGIYKVDDGTGSLWVITQRNVPTTGARVKIKGRIQNAVVYNGKNYGLGMFENERQIQ